MEEQSKPVAYFDSVSVSVHRGETVRLVCATHGHPAANNFTWYKHEQVLPSQSSDVLTWIATGSETESVYKCKAANSVGVASTKFIVNVFGSRF